MGTLNLKGTLNLMGTLNLKDKVQVEGVNALIEVQPGASQGKGIGILVNLPPPPVGPSDPGLDVYIVASFNKTVTAKNVAIVALGMVMQGNNPSWPGMMLPSSSNTKVTITQIAINVENDQAIVFPQGGTASFPTSGQS